MGRRQTSLLATGIAMALLLLSACSDGPHDKPAPARHELRKGDQYVAIGDSSTSAPQTGPATNRVGCWQTTMNYPHQVARRLGLKLTDVSCGGATTQHVTQPQVLGDHSQPPQLDAVSRATDLVTVSLGANDFGTFGAVVNICTGIRAKDPGGAPCTEANAAAGKNSVEHRIAQIEKRLITVIQLVKKRAPKARVMVVGYPQFFPADGPCAQLPLADGDFPFAHRVNVLLVQAQKNAATKTGVDYVDVFAATKGHDMCSADPWIAGLNPSRSDALFYHPYPEEQRAVTDLLVGLLD